MIDFRECGRVASCSDGDPSGAFARETRRAVSTTGLSGTRSMDDKIAAKTIWNSQACSDPATSRSDRRGVRRVAQGSQRHCTVPNASDSVVWRGP